MENNKFQWGRVDEIAMFIVAILFLIVLAYMGMPQNAIMAMAGSLMTIVPIYIKSALERKNDTGDQPPTILPIVTEKTLVKPPKHHLRDEG